MWVRVAVGHIFLFFIVVDIGLKKLLGFLFVRIVLDVIAWTKDACRTRVSEMD